MPEEDGARTVGISDIPRTIKGGYSWFESQAGRHVKIQSVSLIGNNKGNSRYAALVVCRSREQAKELARNIRDKDAGPRAQALGSNQEVESFRKEMIESKGWSKDAPDGNRAITPNTGADIRGDATGFKHGFNPHRRSPDHARRPTSSPLRRAGNSSRDRSRSRKTHSRSSGASRRKSRKKCSSSSSDSSTS
eukprot:TRINITY_DN38807_c0_g1_i1.p1 TRINITY_DN38807_c0_g1~~TRINITY_DN38807_c0_g1_i1.p1  ORF type:complete len:192 (+),score=21.97 TRINITY_DN38807_c0_g1_i1:88-663(+)